MKDHTPIFEHVFGAAWHQMPPVMRKHYANRPFSNDVQVAKGKMWVKTAPILRFFAPLLRLLGGIPAVDAENIPVTVSFKSETKDTALHFVRHFHLQEGAPYIFHSKMIARGGNDVVEVMKFRLGWCTKFLWQNDKVILAHNGFCLCLFGYFIPLPITWLIGHIHAEEEAIDNNHFKMFVEIRHPLFGKVYEYRGTFAMAETDA